MNLVGLDIGGANLKAADGRGRAVQIPFALWKHPERLEDEVRAMLQSFGALDRVAITMTGELCDCFDSKAAGVRHILDSVGRAAAPVPLRIWTTAGDFRSRKEIDAEPLLAAAANWLALATYSGRLLRDKFSPLPRYSGGEGSGVRGLNPLKAQGASRDSERDSNFGVLIDLGSTTCDIIPLKDGIPQPLGRTDPARLATGELVYCGVRRTPLCAVFGLTKAAEWFATTADAYVVLGDLPEEPDRTDSADGRPQTKAHAQSRLARMECDEGTAWTWDQTLAFARLVRDLQVRRVAESVVRVAARLPRYIFGVVFAGAGEFLVPAILEAAGLGSATRISLSEKLGPDLSLAACAHAVAVLAAEER